MASESSRVLVLGGTGYIGKHLVKASISLGHPTHIYSTQLTPHYSSDSKKELLQEFQSLGVTIVYGTLEEQEKLVGVLRQVDVVICTFAYPQVFEQFKIIDAIKLAGNIKGAYFINLLLRPHENPDTLVVYGTGDVKAVLTYEEDLAAYTIKAANDPRTCNRVVNSRPQGNIISLHELISLWEKKTGRSFNEVYVTEEELVKQAETLPNPDNIGVSILHTVFVKGEAVIDFEAGETEILEASQLYPDYKYTTIDELLEIMLVNPPKPALTAMA
ncbi:hypothetical protein TIFTF001_044901 [Ficus carica]|uniref:NmrA-like domain-containing protein n=1 Tax=Ficus carica TaxID=3494 RepID=A0AA88CWE2_FICCA|nr:hypothetical protein TIFTF001_044901 [Ficus carica]